jgi:TonB-dependent receptor
MKLNSLLLFLLLSLSGFSQTGTLTGVILDKEYNNEPLPFANITIKGTTIGSSTDDTGKYSITIEPGNYTLVIAYLGYETKEIPFTITASEKKVINYTLEASGVQLKDIEVAHTVTKESEVALLQEQQKSIEMKQAIGAQELSRKGISDAATAVTKVSGITKQEGSNNLFVRGLGDRYNSTSLNELPLPSEDPEYKNISLRFFPTNIIKNININKTFSANLYGDVAGANINVSSKELEKNSLFNIYAGTGYNTNALNATFLVADGFNYFGYLQNGSGVPISNLNNYSFNTSYKPNVKNNVVNTNFNISGGKKFIINDEQSISIFGVILSNSSFTQKQGLVRQVNSSGGFRQNMTYEKSEYNASQSLLGNVKYKFGSGRSISYNTLYIHDNTQTVGDYNGFASNINDNNDPSTNSIVRRQQTNNNNLFTNQLIFDYKVSNKFNAKISAAYNMIRGSEPDRKTNSYDFSNTLNGYVIATNSPALNHRFFSSLEENDLVGKAEFEYDFNADKTEENELFKKITFGVDARTTNRRFEATQFNFDFATNNIVVDLNNPDAIFNQANVDLGKDNGGFDIITGRGSAADALNPFYYTGKRNIIAGYLQGTYSINEKLIIQPGFRFEKIDQKVEWDTNISSSVNNLTIDPSIINKNYFLPSLNVKYTASEKNAIRLAASQTYTYPQFKETAPFLYEDINFQSFGNAYLVPATNINFDLKYDFYLSRKEIISVGGYYKNIKNPINRVRVASAANELSYVNTDNAFATGIELEARKNIYNVEGEKGDKNLSFGLNLSYLYSEQKLTDSPNDNLTVLFTKKTDKLEGSSPLLINSDLSYNFSNEKNILTSTVVFNYFYDKIYSLGTSGNENIVEKSIPALDFVNKFEIKKYNLGISLSIKNILNPNVNLTQKTDAVTGGMNETIVSSYKKGMFFSFGLNWTL